METGASAALTAPGVPWCFGTAGDRRAWHGGDGLVVRSRGQQQAGGPEDDQAMRENGAYGIWRSDLPDP